MVASYIKYEKVLFGVNLNTNSNSSKLNETYHKSTLWYPDCYFIVFFENFTFHILRHNFSSNCLGFRGKFLYADYDFDIYFFKKFFLKLFGEILIICSQN